MKKIYFALFLLIFVACGESEKTNTITIEDRYSMEIPDFMTSTSLLNDEASLQYQHAIKELYVIVIDENKLLVHDAIDDAELEESYTKDLEGYCNLIMEQTEGNFAEFKMEEYKTSEINGLKLRTIEVQGKADAIDGFLIFGFVEGKDYYYQIMTWTLMDRKDTHIEKMYKMINSFKELSKK